MPNDTGVGETPTLHDYFPLSAWIIILGGVALIALAVLQWWRLHKGGMFSTNFVVLFGIVLVVTLGTVLAILPIQDSARTASFTLFGTVAGYLAGRKAPRFSKESEGAEGAQKA